MASTLRGVILDVDGTLIDSNDAHAHAWVEALHDAGLEVPFDEVRRRIGMGGDKLLPEVANGLQDDSPRGKRIGERRKAIFRERWLPTLRPLPGAHALLTEMHRRGLVLVVASSARPDELDPLLHRVGVERLIHHKTSSADASQSKPDPDIVHVAIARSGVPADALIMLGDTGYDIEAAGRAGLDTIGVTSGGWSREDLRGAVAVYDDCAALLAAYDDSPLARRG